LVARRYPDHDDIGDDDADACWPCRRASAGDLAAKIAERARLDYPVIE
jgi:hypothetical protein